MTSEADTAALIQALQQNAKRLGLSWDLTMATVTNGSDTSNVAAVFDANTVAGVSTAGLISMVGALATGDRVYVMQIQPAGNYVVGRAGPPPGDVLAHVTSTALAAFTTEIVLLTLPTVTYQTGHAFEVEAKLACTCTGAGFLLVLARRGTTTAGAAIGEWEFPTFAGGVANNADCRQRFVNNSGNDITQRLALTGVSTVGTATAVHASPFGPFWFSVKDLGDSKRFPGLNSI